MLDALELQQAQRSPLQQCNLPAGVLTIITGSNKCNARNGGCLVVEPSELPNFGTSASLFAPYRAVRLLYCPKPGMKPDPWSQVSLLPAGVITRWVCLLGVTTSWS